METGIRSTRSIGHFGLFTSIFPPWCLERRGATPSLRTRPNAAICANKILHSEPTLMSDVASLLSPHGQQEIQMSTLFHFVGRVVPDHIPLTVAYSPKFERTPSQQGEPKCVIEVSIYDGEFRVSLEVAEYSDRVAMSLFQAAWDAAQHLANTVGFIHAVPYQIIVDYLERPDGAIKALALGDVYLRNLSTFTPEDIETISDLLIADHALGQAMSDLLSMLSKTHYAPISYGRVAESIARLVAPSEKPKSMWSTTRNELKVSEGFLRQLTDVSTDPRHGTRTPVSAASNRRLSEMSWRLMDRYLHYRLKNGDLADDKFPILTE